MNYLAHLYLSENDKNILLGNFIADAVKGSSYKKYSEEIQLGIVLHRCIDSFTDNDLTVKKSKRRLHPRYKHFKGIIIDIFYDHFLAKNWNDYSTKALNEFSQSFYEILNENKEILPEKIQTITPYIIKNDWLTNYRTLDGIEKVLIGMNKRTGEISQMNLAINDLKDNYRDFEDDFEFFFEKLRIFSAKKLEELKILNQKNI
ncbi:MAG: ACP phosphodiesterase [Bacteroidota bacterium]